MKDPISIVETAYDLRGSNAAWLAELSAAFVRAMPGSLGALSFQYDASSDEWIHMREPVVHQLSAEFVAAFFSQEGFRPGSPALLAGVFRRLSFASLRSTIDSFVPQYGQVLARFGIEDFICINAIDPTARGCVVCVADRPQVYSPRAIRMWKRISAHVSAANRLRKVLQALTAESSDPTQHAEAVLTPGGRLEHATGPAAERSQQDLLRDALVRIDKARSRQEEPELAVDLWQGLVAGRWSIVEHFERDGKRYYLAHRNDPSLAPDRTLSPRERQVFGYAELGQSNKLIAYSLGLSVSTVSTLLARARRKLGISIELARELERSSDDEGEN
jgi:DNA-binding CsgD family transcriptional regulator